MDYYIKYFDKKYLSTTGEIERTDYQKIVAYNKQLLALSEIHSDKIASLIRDMSYFYKQLQEGEAQLNTTTIEIDAMVKNMRILPLSTIFKLFPRMVHRSMRR